MFATAKRSLALAALLASTSALAATPDWKVSEVSGSVTVSRGGKVLTVHQGSTLRAGDVIRTGSKGRAVLVRGKEFVVVSPDAQLKVAVPEESGPVVQFFQYLGNALFKIEKKSTPHFGVKTPYLAAVVKGTTFNVSVGADRSSVQVTEGAVEVATGDDLEAALITPGLIGFVDADDAGELVVIAGNRAGEDLSGAIVRGTPEFVRKPPQARSEQGNRPGASDFTPAAIRSNGAAGSDQPIKLALLDDAVSGGDMGALSEAGRDATEQSAPETDFVDDASSDNAAGSAQGEVVIEETEPVLDEDQGGNDGDNGHGNDPEGFDDSNPGKGNGLGVGDGADLDEVEDSSDRIIDDNDIDESSHGNGNDEAIDVGEDLDLGDDGNNGHGNDPDGVDPSNPGKGNSGSQGAEGGDFAIANSSTDNIVDISLDDDAADDDGNENEIDVGNDLDLDLDDDGNKGHGNDDDGYDEDNPGKGKGKGRGNGGGKNKN